MNIKASEIAAVLKEEIKNYSRLTSLTENDNSTSDYIYDGAVPWYSRSDVRINSRTSGFDIGEGNDWLPLTSDLNADVFYFGNPYSRASENNYILQIFDLILLMIMFQALMIIHIFYHLLIKKTIHF